ncbi:hypothetical protein BDW22DRAFT_1357333 [Trametopsis cervina]|nr:hypothetical protein BDW22DRAFT_1357333 [Trametopsis cervina]
MGWKIVLSWAASQDRVDRLQLSTTSIIGCIDTAAQEDRPYSCDVIGGSTIDECCVRCTTNFGTPTLDA